MQNRKILELYPLPIARAYRRFCNASEPLESHEAAYYLYEVYLKYIASLAIAVYLAGDSRDHRLNAALKGLTRPHLGEWIRFLRESLRFLTATEQPEFMVSVLRDLYETKEGSWAGVVSLYNRLRAHRTGAPSRSEKVTLGSLLDEIVAYRNRVRGHGALPSREHCEEFQACLGDAFSEVLERSPFLTACRLVVFDSIQIERGARIECGVVEYMGDQPVRRERPHEIPYGAKAPEKNVLYLLGQDGEFLLLDPLLVSHREDVYVLNEAKGSPEYLSYATNDHYSPSTVGETQRALFERILGYGVDSSRVGQIGNDVARVGETIEPAAAPEAEDERRRLGDFLLAREIGRGAMGVVFEALQESLRRRVALKVLPGTFALDPKRVERFRREARATARIHHPNIVPVYEVGEAEGSHYYAMEYIDGSSLDELIERARKDSLAAQDPAASSTRGSSKGSSTADPAYIAHAAEQVAALAEGVDEAHRLGLIHRDVKPSNVLVDSAGRFVLVDFGLVREEEAHTLTRSGEMVGTLTYMSPEQVSRRRVDARCDVYALGVTLYEILTLEPPFRGESDLEIQNAILFRDPVPPRTHNPKLNRDLETIILHALEKDPDRRYATAAELAADLKRFLRYEPIRARPQSTLTRIARKLWRHRVAAGFLGLALVLLAVLAFALAYSARVRGEAALAKYESEVPELARTIRRHWMSRIASWGSLMPTDIEGFSQAIVGEMRPEIEKTIAELDKLADSVVERPEASFYQAQGLSLIGEDDRALKKAKEALGRDPAFLPALLLRASLLEKRGESEAVRRALKEAAELTGEDEAWARAWLRAQGAFRDRRWSVAVEALDELTGRDTPEPYPGANFDSWLMLGVTRLEVPKPDYAKAKQAFWSAKALDIGALEPDLLLGKVYYLQGETTLGDTHFRQIYEKAEPSRKEAVAFGVAGMYHALRNLAKGLEWAEAITDPCTRARILAGFHYYRGDWEQAIRECKKALELRRDDFYTRIVLVWTLCYVGRPEEGIDVCQEWLENPTDNDLLLRTLGRCLRGARRFAEAIQWFQGYVDRHRDSATARHQLGECYTAMGQFEIAREWHQKGLGIKKTSWGHQGLGEALRALGNLPEARQQFELALRCEANVPVPHLLLARLLSGTGDVRNAFDHFVRYIEIRPERLNPHEDLRQIVESHGDSVPEEDLERGAKILQTIVDTGRIYNPVGVLRALTAILLRLPQTDERNERFIKYARWGIEAEQAGLGGGVPEMAGILAAYHHSRGDKRAAIVTLERALREPWRAQLLERQLEEYRQEGPDCWSFASVDDALVRSDREVLVPPRALWRYAKGTAEPPGDWMAAEFDEAETAWESGPSGFGYGDDDDETGLDDMRYHYSTVYVRHRFPVRGRDRYTRFRLSVRIDDGYVAYLNGQEVRRLHVPAGPVGHESLATEYVGRSAIQDSVWLPRDLFREGENVLAVQVLNISLDSSDLTLIPVLEAELPADPRRDQAALEEFRAAVKGDDAPHRIAYFEGRVLQRQGEHAEAAKRFREVLAVESSFPEPYLRLAESLRRTGDGPASEKTLREALRGSLGGSREVWNAWVDACARGLGFAPGQILKQFPENPSEYGADIRWLLEELSDGASVRINSGGVEPEGSPGALWGRDRFFTGRPPASGGAPLFEEDIAGADDDAIYRVCRSWEKKEAGPCGYRIPLPPGKYRVVLHFAETDRRAHSREPGKRTFDVLLEGGEEKLERYQLFTKGFATADQWGGDVFVGDALLEIDFVRRVNDPLVCGIEIRRE